MIGCALFFFFSFRVANGLTKHHQLDFGGILRDTGVTGMFHMPNHNPLDSARYITTTLLKTPVSLYQSIALDMVDSCIEIRHGRSRHFSTAQYPPLVNIRVTFFSPKGIFLPISWAPMPSPDMTVHTVTLVPGSSEYQNVVSKFQASTGGMHFPKIERVQNPHLYKQYMIRKQKMDKDNGGNNERQLFHGTYAENIRAINTQGFNRSFCGAHGKLQLLERSLLKWAGF